ncbi:hypothetical protein GCM10009527_095650 [Actinomadura nitritigenes]
MVTFGEMTALAGEHLTDLKNAIHAPDTTHQAAEPPVRSELSQLAHVLVRYHDQIATGFGVPHTPEHGVRDAARRAAALISRAEHLLGPRPTSETPETVLAEKIRCVSIALGCGLDLLASHSPTTPSHRASADAPTIAATDTARTVLHQLSDHVAVVGHLTKHTGEPSNTASKPLLTAAVLSRVFGMDARPPVNMVPLHRIPERIPPRVGERFTEAVVGISASIQRLGNPHAPGSIATWRYLARAGAITCDINSKIILHLTRRLGELGEGRHLATLKQVASLIRNTSGKWKAIARRWDAYPAFGNPAAGLATDAGDLIVRLGRLVHADPAWTPGPRASYQVKPPEEFAASRTDVARVATVSLKAFEACNIIAAHHRTAINDLAVISLLQQQEDHPTFSPRVPSSIRQLLGLYESTEVQGAETVTALGRTIEALAVHDPSHTDEARLIARRAAAKAAPNQSRLAAAGFPTDIANCLTGAQPRFPSPPPSGRVRNSRDSPTHRST